MTSPTLQTGVKLPQLKPHAAEMSCLLRVPPTSQSCEQMNGFCYVSSTTSGWGGNSNLDTNSPQSRLWSSLLEGKPGFMRQTLPQVRVKRREEKVKKNPVFRIFDRFTVRLIKMDRWQATHSGLPGIFAISVAKVPEYLLLPPQGDQGGGPPGCPPPCRSPASVRGSEHLERAQGIQGTLLSVESITRKDCTTSNNFTTGCQRSQLCKNQEKSIPEEGSTVYRP